MKHLGKIVLFSHVLSACISKSGNSGGSIRCTEKSKVFWFLVVCYESGFVFILGFEIVSID